MSIIKYCTFFSRQNSTKIDNFQTKEKMEITWKGKVKQHK